MDKQKHQLKIYRALTWLVLLAIWILVSNLQLFPSKLVPSPLNVLMTFKQIIFEGYNGISFVQHYAISLVRLMSALFLAILVGVPLGLMCGYLPKLNAVIDSLIQFYRPLPPLAYYTLLILWMGIGEPSKVVLLFLAGLAPIYVACLTAVKQIDPLLIRSGQVLGANKWTIFRKIIIPASLPQIFSGIRTAMGVTYTTLVSAEMVAATSGIGWMVIDASRYLRSEVIFVGIIVMGLTGIFLDLVIQDIQRLVVFWADINEQTNKKFWSRLRIGLLILAILTSFFWTFKDTIGFGQAIETVKIGTIRVPNDKQVSDSLGIMKDKFEEKGIEVEFVFFDSGVAANQALYTGDIQFAEMGYTNGIVALASGVPAELIWLHDVLGENEALVVREDSIKTIADLKGKKIATPFSSTAHYSLLTCLKEAGIEKEVTLLDMTTQDIVAAWQRGDIDAAYSWEPTLSELKKDGKVLVTSRQLAEKGIATYNVDLVNKEFAQKHPDLVQVYVSALNQSVELYRKEPEQVINALAKSLNLSEIETKKQIEMSQWLSIEEQLSSSHLGTQAKSGQFIEIFEDTADFLAKQNAIDQVPNKEAIERFINTDYMEEVQNHHD